MSEQITCPRCHGEGHTELEGVLCDTLDALRQSYPATSAQVHERLQARGYSSVPTSTMNHLKKLVGLKLVERRGKSRRHFLYRIPSPPTPPAETPQA